MTDYDGLVEEAFSIIDHPSMDCACCRKRQLEGLLNHLNEKDPTNKYIWQIESRIRKEEKIMGLD